MKDHAHSHIFLSKRSSDELFSIERRILEAYDGGIPLSDEEFRTYVVMIESLVDSTYLGCGIDPELNQTFRTTSSGRKYLRAIRMCGFKAFRLE